MPLGCHLGCVPPETNDASPRATTHPATTNTMLRVNTAPDMLLKTIMVNRPDRKARSQVLPDWKNRASIQPSATPQVRLSTTTPTQEKLM